MNEQLLQTLRAERAQILSDLRKIADGQAGVLTTAEVDALHARLNMLNQLLANYPTGKT